jgi:TetR/AcrR family transcriptional regulator, transcriptional repressor for nem operon
MPREQATASAKATATAAATAAATGSGISAPTQRLTRKGQATRDRIVTAAALEMFERGVARTSLDEVKTAAGVSSSQLYHYFADKRALTLAVIEHQTQAILAGQEPLLSNLDSVEALRAWRDLLVQIQRELHCEGGCPIGSIGAELAETDPEARAQVGEGFQRWEQAIGDGLRAMFARGELAGDPDALALALLTALQGGLLLTQIRREPSPLEAALDAMIDHIESLTAD